MTEIIRGIQEALRLLFSFDPEVMRIALLSFRVSGLALLISTLMGIPLGAWLGLRRFLGRRLMVALVYTGMGFPPVVVGLFIYLLLSRSGPLGGLDWLYTTRAMILAQAIISLPLVAGFTMAAVMGVDPELRLQLLSLGATAWQATLALLREARVGVLVAVIAGFGSVISEVGAVMMVGGNIQGSTRVLTTAVVLETSKGNFDLAIALGLILLCISFVINLLIVQLQRGAFK
jgi:tungstate transport system permease protein